MLAGFETVLTFSRGIQKHKALNHFLGNRLFFARLNSSQNSCVIVAHDIRTITASSSFGTLFPDKKNHIDGMPFYASWGPKEDLHNCSRRTSPLCRDDLATVTLLLYHQYVLPLMKELCKIELALVEEIKKQERLAQSVLYRRRKELRDQAITISRRIFAKMNNNNVH